MIKGGLMSSLSLFGIPIPLHNGLALLFNVGSSLESIEMSIGEAIAKRANEGDERCIAACEEHPELFGVESI